MKSADVSGNAIPPQVCHAQADAGAAGEVAGRARAAAVAKPGSAAAAKPGSVAVAILRGVVPRTIDRLAPEAGQRLGASVLRAEPPRAFAIEVPAGHAQAVAGYAPQPRAAAASTLASTTTRTSSAATTRSTGEWAFLDDRSLSIEDKLFKFMKLVMKKSDDDLQKKMKEYTAAKSSTTSSAKKTSGGLFGVLKTVLPPLAALEKVVPALPQLVNKLASDLGPQLLGALMLPLGAPWAAPLVQRAASQLLPAAIATLDGGSTTTGSTSTSPSSASGEDERMKLLEIERMMQKTNQMFATISNILKATHDAAMTAVNNIR